MNPCPTCGGDTGNLCVCSWSQYFLPPRNKVPVYVTGGTCTCIGPQNGAPLCPCKMDALGIFQRNGRWVQPELDLGPVR